LALRLTLTPQESDSQHTERKRATCEGHRLPPRESLKVGHELSSVTLAQIPAESLDLCSPTVSILSHRRLRAFFPKLLTCLANGLRQPGHRLGHVVLTHIQPRRDLICGLLHHWGTLLSSCGTAARI